MGTGDRVRVAADALAARQGSTLSGLCGVVTEATEAVAVRFTFGSFDPTRAQPPGYEHTFAEAELIKLSGSSSPSIPSSPSSGIPSSGSPGPGGDGAPVAHAERCLGAYDAGHRAAAKEGGVGLGGGVSANAWAAAKGSVERAALRGAVQALLLPQGHRGGRNPPDEDALELRPFRAAAVAGAVAGAAADGSAVWCERVTLGICAPDAASGVAALKRWVGALDLPRGVLHGMDLDGEPLAIEGPVYVKYNSGTRTFAEVRANGGAMWKPGDAFLNSYDGDYRGVGFVPHLSDGEPRHYAYLPLDLF